MKATINHVSYERQFEPFDLTINVRSKSELNELLARPGDIPIEGALTNFGVYSVLLEEYRKYWDNIDESKYGIYISWKNGGFNWPKSVNVSWPEEYTKEDILQLSHAIKEYSRRSSTIDVISRVVSAVLSDSVLLDSINQLIEKTPNEYAYIGMYPEYAMITITLVPADRTDIDIKIENIPKEKFAEILIWQKLNLLYYQQFYIFVLYFLK